LKNISADFARRMKETDRQLKESSADFDHRMRKFEEMNGGLSNNQGLFAEEYFFNSFDKGKKTFLAKSLMT